MIDETNNFSYANNLIPTTTYYIRAKNSTTSWAYKTKTTLSEEIEMASVAITVFILAVSIGLFGLAAAIHRYCKDTIAFLIIKRSVTVIAIYLMMLNSAIMATIASSSGLPLTSEMFRYMWLFGVAGYVSMGYLVFKTLIDVVRMWKEQVKVRKYGRVGEEL